MEVQGRRALRSAGGLLLPGRMCVGLTQVAISYKHVPTCPPRVFFGFDRGRALHGAAAPDTHHHGVILFQPEGPPEHRAGYAKPVNR
jgi:hypothetical protein